MSTLDLNREYKDQEFEVKEMMPSCFKGILRNWIYTIYNKFLCHSKKKEVL